MLFARSRSSILAQAEGLADKLPPLVVAAVRTADALAVGAHGRRRIGVGDQFFQYRLYTPGESAARIDWRASARREHEYVRETEWEAAQTVYFWVDPSASMNWKSRKDLPTKKERAQLLALALAALLLNGHEQVATLHGMAPSRDATSLLKLAADFDRPDHRSLPPVVPLARRAHVVLVGDFLPQATETAFWLQQMAAQGVTPVLLEIADPAEETFPYTAPTLFEGLEGEGELKVGSPRTVRQAYLDKRHNLRQALQETCKRCGALYVTHLTQNTPEETLHLLYAHLSGGKK